MVYASGFHFHKKDSAFLFKDFPILPKRLCRHHSCAGAAYLLMARACLVLSYFLISRLIFDPSASQVPLGSALPDHTWIEITGVVFLALVILVTEAVLPQRQWFGSLLYQSKIRIVLDILAVPVIPFVLLSTRRNQKNGKLVSEQTDEMSFPRNGSYLPDTEEISSDVRMEKRGEVPDFMHFRETTARQIMCPRMDISAVADHWTFPVVLAYVKETGYSRLPVYHGDVDTITGILYVKDILPFASYGDNFDWLPLQREGVLFVPESVKINMLLKEFQSRRQHMAIIVDEYGGTSGVATLEDIMEELVGEIKDEFDAEEEQVFKKIGEGHFIFDGKTLLQDVCRIAGLSSGYFDAYRKEADSIGGLILEKTGNIPQEGKVIQVGNIALTAEHINKNRIERIALEIQENEGE